LTFRYLRSYLFRYLRNGRLCNVLRDGQRVEAGSYSACVGQLMAVQPIAPAMLAAIMNDARACAPDTSERAREIIALRLASPKRSNAGQPVEQQQDAAHLPLFVHANEPKFI
jgi:hypothetical protein